MKIGIQTNTLDAAGYGRWKDGAYEKLKEHGFSCSDFEMCNTDSLIYTSSPEDSDAFLIHEKELAERAGIEIVQVHGPWRWPPRDLEEEDRNERMEKMKKSIRAAPVLGVKNWVIHPIMPYGIDDLNTGKADATWDLNLSFMTELLKTAKEYDVTICFENMPMHNFSLAKPDEILKFVKTINDDHFKICLDTGHVSVFTELDLGTEVRKLGDEIRTLHVHDNMYCQDLHLMPYFGIIDWNDFAKALRDIKFDGCFSLETIPSRKLPDDIFEKMCVQLVKISEEIVSKY